MTVHYADELFVDLVHTSELLGRTWVNRVWYPIGPHQEVVMGELEPRYDKRQMLREAQKLQRATGPIRKR